MLESESFQADFLFVLLMCVSGGGVAGGRGNLPQLVIVPCVGGKF